jgi:membrane protease YdiL (CAAX protease family)
VSWNEFMTFEHNPEPQSRPRSLLAPPGGTINGPKAILWNEHELRAGWRLLIFLLLFALFASAETFLTIALHLPQVTRGELTATALLLQEGLGAIAAMAAAAILGLLERRAFGVYGLPGAEAFGARFWQGMAWGIVMITAMIMLIRLLGGFSFGELALRGSLVWRYAMVWGLVFLCVGFFEEFLFRGYAQFTLATGLQFWPAATMLSAAFGALHLANGGEDRVGALSVFVIGMFFCLTLRRTGNLWFAVGLHASFDWGETFLFSVPNSGIVAPGHLLNSSFHGPAWLTGGSVGPEGSVMAFVVVGVAAVIFSRVYPPRFE